MIVETADLNPAERELIESWCARPLKFDDGAIEDFRQGLYEGAAVVAFPPLCVVRANRPLRIPEPGRFAVVAGYIEADIGVCRLEDMLAQVPEIDRGMCEPDWLEIVGYRDYMTPAYVARVFGN
ncbi:hypothetical protein [Hyphomicrobium sp.]|uniref:hypothetical protein n=1 Tax=Hyphomicrobium sp. TaxID=82 RepID=UPI001DB99544|nr:hypothetical protein [Hyphomicrobium sp.]MBY0561548.1 hypothetical protein [Hyphomicrobium sp.]